VPLPQRTWICSSWFTQHAEGFADIGNDLDLEGRRWPAQIAAHPLADSAHTSSENARTVPQSIGFAGNHVVGGAGVNLVIDKHRRFQGIALRLDEVCSACPSVIHDHNGILERPASRRARHSR